MNISRAESREFGNDSSGFKANALSGRNSIGNLGKTGNDRVDSVAGAVMQRVFREVDT